MINRFIDAAQSSILDSEMSKENIQKKTDFF